MRAEIYQWALILLLAATVGLGGYFVYQEIEPQYKIFQKTYVELEEFRSSYTGEPPAAFQNGVKQIVLFPEDKRGPETIDRCITCHVALDIPHYSPTKLAYDVNGNLVLNPMGNPVKIPNEDYIWKKLDDKIASLTDPKIIRELTDKDQNSVVQARLAEAERLKTLKITVIDDRVIDMTKALSMHPLIGREVRPFEFHPTDKYGCSSCHSGNGRALTLDKAHGPVFDNEYEEEFEGPKPHFTESDSQNDPQFSIIFNHKPGPDLLFQTTPILVGGLIEAKCVQCHQSTRNAFHSLANKVESLTNRKDTQINEIKKGMLDDKKALLSLLELRKSISSQGYRKTLDDLARRSVDYTLDPAELKKVSAQLQYLSPIGDKEPNEEAAKKAALTKIDHDIERLVGSVKVAEELEKILSADPDRLEDTDADILIKFYEEHQEQLKGSLFAKAALLNVQENVLEHVKKAESNFQGSVNDEHVINSIVSDIDILTKTYHHGEQLYISQACYACHRIAAFSRGGVGPELTNEGKGYPWFIKQKLVWPQGDLRTSTMPNMLLDHVELEALVTYMLGQTGKKKSESDVQYQTDISDWEAGRKMWWEKPLDPDQITNVHNSMIIFATQGCASCHKLKGFESNVGFKVEAGDKKPDFNTLYKEKEWFESLFPEDIIGSRIVEAIEQHSDEIDRRISPTIRHNSILEEIESSNPEVLEAYYSPFRYASRVKNFEYRQKADAEKDPKKRAEIMHQLDLWQEKVHHVLMMFIQEYGLGRLIGPRLNWSGIYRSDQWLMDHFHNPSAEIPKSLMPAFPFDDTKFYALTYMLDTLAKRNRDEVQAIWQNRGFDPLQAFHIHCAICHGEDRLGNGPVSEWIYPIPKNLTNGTFLRELTKPRAIQSITHGVKGTPMPPWGEVATDKPAQIQSREPELTAEQIKHLVDWLFFSVSGSNVNEGPEEVPKWKYQPEDVLEEMHREGGQLKPGTSEELKFEKSSEASKPEPKVGMRTQKANPFVLLAQMPWGLQMIADFVTSAPETKKDEPLKVEDVFDIGPPLVPGPDKHSYYIKKKFYTEENLLEGQLFFEANCTICHGREGDGTGIRAETMTQSKPRMLINLRWLNTRDDLRLLRSIKYGVPGTAMTPWGDMTTALQRLQLVMYIHSLSSTQDRQLLLLDALYETFDTMLLIIEEARSHEYTVLDKLSKEIDTIKAARDKLYSETNLNEKGEKEAITDYQLEIDLRKKLKERERFDQLHVELKNEVEKESGFYETIGKSLILQKMSDDDFNADLRLIKLNQGRYSIKDQKLQMQIDPKNTEEAKKIEQSILDHLSDQIEKLKKEKVILVGHLPSEERDKKLTDIDANITPYTKLKEMFITNMAEAQRSKEQQIKIYKELKTLEEKNSTKS